MAFRRMSKWSRAFEIMVNVKHSTTNSDCKEITRKYQYLRGIQRSILDSHQQHLLFLTDFSFSWSSVHSPSLVAYIKTHTTLFEHLVRSPISNRNKYVNHRYNDCSNCRYRNTFTHLATPTNNDDDVR